MSTDKPTPVLQIQFKLGEVRPDRIPFSVLSDVISAVQGIAFAEQTNQAGDTGETNKFRLLTVRKGSAIYTFAGPPASAFSERLKRTDLAIQNPEEADEVDGSLRFIEKLSHAAEVLGSEIVVVDAATKKPLVRFTGETFNKIAGTAIVSGESELYGRVLRIGGASRRTCSMRVEFQRRPFYCKVDSIDLASELGKLLYQEVLAVGFARWVRGSMSLYSFTIHQVHQPKRGSILDAYKAIQEAGASDWGLVQDPEAFIKDLGE